MTTLIFMLFFFSFYKTCGKEVDDKQKAYCKVCIKSFSVSELDVKAPGVHTERKSHLLKCPSSNQQKLKFQATEKDEAIERSKQQDNHISLNRGLSRLK